MSFPALIAAAFSFTLFAYAGVALRQRYWISRSRPFRVPRAVRLLVIFLAGLGSVELLFFCWFAWSTYWSFQ
jgi:hypothetical protein